MRPSLTFLSVCASASTNRRPSLRYQGIVVAGRGGTSKLAMPSFFSRRCIITSSNAAGRAREMESSGQSERRRPRNENDEDVDDEGETDPDDNIEYCHDEDDNTNSISPYETRMGGIISTCAKCHGEGRVRAMPSRKARAANRRRMNRDSCTGSGGDAATIVTPPGQVADESPPTRPCHVCEGTGLIVIVHPPSDASSTQSAMEGGEMGGRGEPQSSPISVAIVGGGIGGIALAAALQHRDIPCVVYERDTSFEERKQGYGLTMQQGARALRSLGFFALSDDDDLDDDKEEKDMEVVEGGRDGVVSNPRAKFGIHSTRHVVHKPCGTVVGEWGMRVWGGRFEKNGRTHAKRQNAHISRQNLRKMLMEMVRPGTIRWGHVLTGYSREGDRDNDGNDNSPSLKLTFRRRRSDCQGGGDACDDVISTSATVLVGCDGIRSAVRAKKLGDEVAPLRYLGCIVILGIAASPNSSLTDGETVFQTADGITRLYAMPYAPVGEDVSTIAGGVLDCPTKHGGLSMWQLSFPMDEDESKRLSELGPSALKAEALKRCGHWHDPIPALLSLTPEDLITGYPCYDRATVENELFRAGCKAPQTASADPYVTMLGDAAHPMSPFKGQGANQALLDAVLLARKLARIIDKRNLKAGNPDDALPAALAEFEEEMLKRSAVKVAKSADAAKFLHSHVAISEGNVTRGGAALGGTGKVTLL